MNIVFLIVAATFMLFMLIGYKRGLFRSVASTIAIVLAVFLTSAIYPAVNRALCDHTRLDDTIKEMIIEKFDLKVEEVDLPKSVQMEKLDEMNIPESVKELIIENSNKTTYAEAGVNGFFDFAAQYLTNMVMKGIAYVLTFFVIMLFLSIGIALSNIATGIPIVNGINKCIRRLARATLCHRVDDIEGLEGPDDAKSNDQIGDRLQTRQRNCKELLNLACTVNLCGLIQRCRDVHQSCIENNEEISDIFPDRRDTYCDQCGAGLSEPVDRTDSEYRKHGINNTAVCREQQGKQRSDEDGRRNNRDEQAGLYKTAIFVLEFHCDHCRNDHGKNRLHRNRNQYVDAGILEGRLYEGILQCIYIVFKPTENRTGQNTVVCQAVIKGSTNRNYKERDQKQKTRKHVQPSRDVVFHFSSHRKCLTL